MVLYAFDVDETLEVSKGPVKLFDLVKLREHGHIVGLCGNWAMVTLHYPDWHHICSFVGPCGIGTERRIGSPPSVSQVTTRERTVDARNWRIRPPRTTCAFRGALVQRLRAGVVPPLRG